MDGGITAVQLLVVSNGYQWERRDGPEGYTSNMELANHVISLFDVSQTSFEIWPHEL